ncbi:hypothetical protein HYT57_01855, partial [Candidatus Woesearchaeota archaeon]|nr:hypothetical protein [Candidatus Woesearchaeota archaeon]
KGIEISEFSTGFEIATQIEAESPVTIAVNTDKWAKCKYSETVNIEYDNMPRYITNYPPILKEHNTTFYGLEYGRKYEYYLRCENKDGFANERDYKISFFIKPGIDGTAPYIAETSVADNSYIAYNKNSTLLDISVRDDNSVECKWSRSNIEFDQMNNNFSCFANSINGYFSCSTNLTDINLGLNTYYFACKDCASYGNGDIDPSTLEVGDVLPDVCNATERNTMDPIDFNLYGSNKLNIVSTSPSGTLYYNDITLMAGTSGGAENGKAVCRFNKEDKSFIGMGIGSNFYNTNSTTHTQSLVNLSGNSDGINYLYYIQCQDKVGNNANSTIQFTVAVDTAAPSLLYIYKDESLIHVILNEASKCQYSGNSFVYGDGTAMSGDGTTEHTVSLGGPYHIICEDMYDNLIQDEFVVY